MIKYFGCQLQILDYIILKFLNNLKELMQLRFASSKKIIKIKLI